MAITYDAAIASTAASASGSKSDRTMPVRNIAGRKMASVVMVPASTGVATSSVPARAATSAESP